MPYAPYSHPWRLEGSGLQQLVQFFDDFHNVGTYAANAASVGFHFDETANYGTWKVTVIDTDTDNNETILHVTDEIGGGVAITNNVDALDQVQIQTNSRPFKPTESKTIYYATRVKLDVPADMRFGCGLATYDTTILDLTASGVSQVTPTDCVGFHVNAEAGNIQCVTKNTSTNSYTDSGTAFSTDTFMDLALEVISNTAVKYYVNGAFVTEHVTGFPAGNMAPWYTVGNDGSNDASTAHVLSIQQVLAQQPR